MSLYSWLEHSMDCCSSFTSQNQIQASWKARVFEQMQVDSVSRPLSSLTLSYDKASVYIVANKTDDSAVYHQPLIDCSTFMVKSCQACLTVSPKAEVQNPLCGWCAETSSCTRPAQCKSGRWETASSQCPKIKGMLKIGCT